MTPAGTTHHAGTAARTGPDGAAEPRTRLPVLSADLVIRPAVAADAAAIATIYNEGIAGGEATFETRLRDAQDVASWLGRPLPVLVAVLAGEVIGFARVGAYSRRRVYAGVGEHAVYVTEAARGRGAGRALLEALAQASEAAGLYKLTSRIFTTNTASIAAHRAAGFDVVGVQRHHGRLEGRWLDCVLVERLLGDAAAASATPPDPA